ELPNCRCTWEAVIPGLSKQD
ncbi:phage head morphogenesis protein, partial [Klebsiella pneumoniae]